MHNYKNKVCLIQSETVFEDDTRKDYLKIRRSQLLTSSDAIDIFDFIEKWVRKNRVYNFVLHIDSKVLSELIDYMDERRKKSRRVRNWLKECTFIATFSNANYIREKVKSMTMNANIYFSLSPISEVLRSVPDGSTSLTENDEKEILLVVSDTENSPFFDQIYDYFDDVNTTLVKYKLKDLTMTKLNDFATNGGYLMVLALDTEEEYNTLGSMVKASTYSKQVHYIECTQILSKGVEDIRSKVSDIQTSASGVCIQGILDGLNKTIPYESCAASLTLTWKCWETFKEGRIINKPL
jgi:hypothetical protein